MISWIKIKYFTLKLKILSRIRRFKNRNDDPFVY